MLVVRRMAHGVADHFQMRVSEWVMLVPTVGTALSLMWFPDMFDMSPSFAGLARWADESTWAIFAWLVAAMRVSALGVNGTFAAFPFSPHVRAGASAAGAIFWAEIAAGFLSALISDGGAPTGVNAYSTFVLLELVNVWRSFSDIGRQAAR
ncbi:hypothetical protein ATO13_23801 [Stappia sp. 22II-S9-Z10]|nr:hypothetical protein ATO13_23801 [Stappia sp. 22II-S9-Z10]